MPESTPKSPAVAHAMALLRHIADSPGQGVTSIARAIGISPSSCFNILRTLEGERMVAFDPISKIYTLGAGLADLAGRALDPGSLFRLTQSPLSTLARNLGATCPLWRVLPEGRLLMLGAESDGQAARIHLEIGQRLPLPLGAAGRSVIAALDLDRDEIIRRFAAVRWDAPPSPERYLEEIEQTRRQGWALDNGAYIGGVISVAAAVSDPRGDVTLSVSTVFFSGQRSQADLAHAGAATLQAARDISVLLYGGDVAATD